MKTYEVRFSVNGKSGFSHIVSARDVMQARRIAKGELQGALGYTNKKVESFHEVLHFLFYVVYQPAPHKASKQTFTSSSVNRLPNRLCTASASGDSPARPASASASNHGET